MKISSSASLSRVAISPQKLRLLADQVRGISVDKALNLLHFSNRGAAPVLKKVLNSAIANAEQNEGADIDLLFVSEVQINAGPIAKRIHIRARGRADRRLKRTSSIILKVTERQE